MGLFGGEEKTPKELVNEWSHKLRKEGYQLDRQIRCKHEYIYSLIMNALTKLRSMRVLSVCVSAYNEQNKSKSSIWKNSIQREELKIKKSLKEAAKKNDRDTCTILAKEVLRARKAVTKIYTSKAHINSVQLQMKNQLATLRVAGALSKSTEVMQAMQRLVRIPEVANTMQEMSKEMMKAGIIEEMLDETMEVLEDDSEEMEEAAQHEVDKVLWELTEGKLGEAPAPPLAEKEPEPEPAIEEDNEEELEDMQSRLAALKS